MSDSPLPLDDLTAEKLARYRAGLLAPAERAAFEREALDRPELAEALYADLALGAVLAARGAARPVRPARRWLAPALAAVLLAVAGGALWWPARRDGPAPVRRGVPPALRLIAPADGAASAPARFTWSRDPGASEYRLEVFDAEGRRRFTQVVRDTTCDAAALGAAPPAAGWWTVTPLDAAGAERPAPAAFRFGPPRR